MNCLLHDGHFRTDMTCLLLHCGHLKLDMTRLLLHDRHLRTWPAYSYSINGHLRLDMTSSIPSMDNGYKLGTWLQAGNLSIEEGPSKWTHSQITKTRCLQSPNFWQDHRVVFYLLQNRMLSIGYLSDQREVNKRRSLSGCTDTPCI